VFWIFVIEGSITCRAIFSARCPCTSSPNRSYHHKVPYSLFPRIMSLFCSRTFGFAGDQGNEYQSQNFGKRSFGEYQAYQGNDHADLEYITEQHAKAPVSNGASIARRLNSNLNPPSRAIPKSLQEQFNNFNRAVGNGAHPAQRSHQQSNNRMSAARSSFFDIE
jgi:hypothetical protein